jgi:dTDP-4-amino-4,6-dideoxygalactose transaminase
MCNATIGLEIAIRALGLTGEVIVPSMTFIATAHALQWQEITPVFCDIDPVTHTIDPNRIEELITPKTTGILPVHVWGQTCDVEAINEIASRRGLRVLYDSAHAFGCTHRGEMVGRFGSAEVFSFHATKFFNALEGGAVVTNDDDFAKKVRLMQNFGFAGYDNVIYIGTNGKMNEISAAMGLTSLEIMDEFVSTNRHNYHRYKAELEGLPGVRLLEYNQAEKNNFQYIVLEIEESITRLSRDALIAMLWAENVLARRYFYPGCHRMEPYRSYFPHAGLLLPVTEAVVSRLLILPTGTAVQEEDVSAICGLLRLALEHPQEVQQKASEIVASAGASK